ncbi:aldo/keto reductase [candidate division KSB1 bacterium]|nr:aldo/keto reductase [candidate division KSB1 bacterium]
MGTSKINRRTFLQAGTMVAVAAGVPLHASQDSTPDPKKILNYTEGMPYRALGKTGIHFSAISLGGSGLQADLAGYAIEKGVNLIHMSPTYKGGDSIRELAKVLKTSRSKVYIALKDQFNDIDEPLKIMGTDHVDFIMFNRHNASAVATDEIKEKFAKWKAAGKVRYAGLTTHDDVKNCVRAGIDSGIYTLMMPVLNQPAYESMQDEIRDAQAKGIGFMGIKTMKDIPDEAMQNAHVAKLMKNPGVTTICKGMQNYEQMDKYIAAVKEVLTGSKELELYRYANANRENACMMCSECKRACPQGIEVSTLLRSKFYYADQLGDQKEAIETFRNIPEDKRDLSACNDCGLCEQACPNGIQIVSRLREAVDSLENRIV